MRYTVVAGDTLSGLALRFYGDAELHPLIASASGIADAAVIHVGQRLIIPDIARYAVVAGDTLSALASRFYGDASLYPLIATVNGIADPDVIDVGQILVVFDGRSDGFGLSIVDRNGNHPRLWYYRFQTSAIGGTRRRRPASRRLPHQRTHLPRPLYVPRGRRGLPPVRLSGHPRPDRRKADHRRDARRRARGLVLQPGRLVCRPAELGDVPHRPTASLDRGEFPNVRRVRRPCGLRVFDGWLRCAEVRGQVLRPLCLGEQPLRPGESAPDFGLVVHWANITSAVLDLGGATVYGAPNWDQARVSADNPIERIDSYRNKRIFLVAGTSPDPLNWSTA